MKINCHIEKTNRNIKKKHRNATIDIDKPDHAEFGWGTEKGDLYPKRTVQENNFLANARF